MTWSRPYLRRGREPSTDHYGKRLSWWAEILGTTFGMLAWPLVALVLSAAEDRIGGTLRR